MTRSGGFRRAGTWRVPAALAAAVAVLGLAACGDDESSGGGGGGETSAAKSTAEIPPKTIGVVDIAGQAPIQQRCVKAIQDAADAIGWETVYQDAQTDASKATRIVQDFVNQGVDGIISVAVVPSWIAGPMRAAQAKGIPTINTCAGVDPPLEIFDGIYAEDESRILDSVAEQLVTDLEADGGGKAMIIGGSFVNAGKLRAQSLREAVKGSEVEIVAQPEVAPATVLQDAEKAVADTITKHPDLKAVFSPFDQMTPPAIAAIKAANKGDQVKVYSAYADAATLPLLRDESSPLVAVGEGPMAESGFVAIDQLLAKLVGEKDIDPDAFKEIENEDDAYYTITKESELPEPQEAGLDDVQILQMDELLKPWVDKWNEEYAG